MQQQPGWSEAHSRKSQEINALIDDLSRKVTQQLLVNSIRSLQNSNKLPDIFNLPVDELIDQFTLVTPLLDRFVNNFNNHVHPHEDVLNQFDTRRNRVAQITDFDLALTRKSFPDHIFESQNQLTTLLDGRVYCIKSQLSILNGTKTNLYSFFRDKNPKPMPTGTENAGLSGVEASEAKRIGLKPEPELVMEIYVTNGVLEVMYKIPNENPIMEEKGSVMLENFNNLATNDDNQKSKSNWWVFLGLNGENGDSTIRLSYHVKARTVVNSIYQARRSYYPLTLIPPKLPTRIDMITPYANYNAIMDVIIGLCADYGLDIVQEAES